MINQQQCLIIKQGGAGQSGMSYPFIPHGHRAHDVILMTVTFDGNCTSIQGENEITAHHLHLISSHMALSSQPSQRCRNHFS